MFLIIFHPPSPTPLLSLPPPFCNYKLFGFPIVKVILDQVSLNSLSIVDHSWLVVIADMQCVEDIDDSKLVPIIVGVVITTVLLVVLILYVVARIVKHRRDSKKEPLLT